MRVLIAVLCLFSVVACGGSPDDPDPDATATRSAEQTEVAVIRESSRPTATPERPSAYEVEYRITSDPAAVVSLTYENDTGGTAQEDGIITPWSITLSMPSGEVAYISAQGNEYAAEITCEIYVNGELAATSTSSGKFVIATCDGRLP